MVVQIPPLHSDGQFVEEQLTLPLAMAPFLATALTSTMPKLPAFSLF